MSVIEESTGRDFIREIIAEDLAAGKCPAGVITRFPPEPNGYLHIGHAKSICLNFGVAQEFGGRCHLRMDDTDPAKEEIEYVNSIAADVKWLGFDWGPHFYHTSDYFDRLYEYAVRLIESGKAYVCELSPEQLAEHRGTPTRPGRPSPWRDRPIPENLELFRKMRDGCFEEGRCTLRAKIDMASPNIHMRDPVLYRIKKEPHHRTGSKWCIFPTYDFSHCLSDAIENVTHSICTLEFEVHRPLYDWILQQLHIAPRPKQIEFARLNLSYTVMSKRMLHELVRTGSVSGWDDPRLPTIAGLRRRGYTPSSIRAFCARIGVTKFNGLTDIALLEHTVREELNRTAPRAMAVLAPIKLVIDNYPEDKTEEIDALNNPEDSSAGFRKVPFSKVLYIEEDDFTEHPLPRFHRLVPGRQVRLRYAYIVTCIGASKDPETGMITEVLCRYDPATRGGAETGGARVKGTIHWVSAAHAATAEVRLYDRLFAAERPDIVEPGGDFKRHLNPDSLKIVHARVEPMLAAVQPGTRYQFERKGYFFADPVDSRPGRPVFNRIVALRDTWAKIAASAAGQTA